MKYGYACVSTDDQNTDLQLAALKRAGCDKTFVDEGKSGATLNRPALKRCLKQLEHGDTLTVWKLDRLGRSVRDVVNTLHDLSSRGVQFQSLTEQIDTTRPLGKAMLHMVALLAELERAPSDPVFPFYPRYLSRAFQRAVIKAQLAPFRFHDLRHCFASSLARLGANDRTLMEAGDGPLLLC
jgi:hypothetical protein